MADPYTILGVRKDASEEEIRKAYRRIAKETHPDLHPGDAAAEARFKEAGSAYAILGDAEKRARFDRGEIDETGAEKPQHPFYREQAEGDPGFKYYTWSGGPGGPGGPAGAGGSPFGDDADIEDVISELFGRRGGTRGRGGARSGGAGGGIAGGDLRYTLPVSFLEAATGAKRRVQMPDGATLDITIPAGLRDGQTLRLRGKGTPGFGGGPAGDALVEVHVEPHPTFRRDGDDVHETVPVTLGEAVNGAKITVQTVGGAVTVTVPKGSSSGRVLRLRGKGIAHRDGHGHGDHLVELRIVLPEHIDAGLAEQIREWEAKHPYDPRNTGRTR